MGNWNITINGIGAHHNTNNITDANWMAAEFVEALIQAGQTVESASFTYGSRDDLMASPAARPLPVTAEAPEILWVNRYRDGSHGYAWSTEKAATEHSTAEMLPPKAYIELTDEIRGLNNEVHRLRAKLSEAPPSNIIRLDFSEP